MGLPLAGKERSMHGKVMASIWNPFSRTNKKRNEVFTLIKLGTYGILLNKILDTVH